MKCKYCKKDCYKKGKRNGIQRYQCKHCKKYQQQKYMRPIIPESKYEWVVKLNNECCGIRSISRLLQITKSSVQRLICKIAQQIEIPVYEETNQTYEIDELRTYCGNKNQECWVIYTMRIPESNQHGSYYYFDSPKFLSAWEGTPVYGVPRDSTNRLKDWLDPLNTGQITLDGRSVCQKTIRLWRSLKDGTVLTQKMAVQ